MNQELFCQNTNLHLAKKNVGVITLIIGSVFFTQSFLSAQTKLGPKSKSTISKSIDKGITIHQEVYFKVSPQTLYETLLSSKEFSESTKRSFEVFSATSATIDPIVGGSFSVFDGHIVGRIVELVPNQRIVEAWRVVDWPAGVYSIARFELKTKDSGTQLIFDHIGFPEGLKEHLATGWQQHYWDALTKYFQ